MNSLGEKIRTLREQRDLTQEQLANLVGVHQTKISHCETGTRGVSFLLLEKLARALGTSRDELLESAILSEQERQVA